MDLGDGIPAEDRVDSGLKIYAVFSPTALKAMKGVRGKLAAQAGHAYLHAWWDAARRKEAIGDLAGEYQRSLRAYKIALIAPDEADEAWFDALLDLYRNKTGVTKVVDAGLTVFDGPTLTCIGIGPIHPDNREDTLSGLKSLT